MPAIAGGWIGWRLEGGSGKLPQQCAAAHNIANLFSAARSCSQPVALRPSFGRSDKPAIDVLLYGFLIV
ncbi:hypothetical protein [Shinella zoogloeoides]|uniref:hypothetical protein n=1 Tax=Shinella zoogloeoides TaxID=352475 RepID=UPI00299EEF4C|nr:hypothetical protein [Shinella zoogloeoides]